MVPSCLSSLCLPDHQHQPSSLPCLALCQRHLVLVHFFYSRSPHFQRKQSVPQGGRCGLGDISESTLQTGGRVCQVPGVLTCPGWSAYSAPHWKVANLALLLGWLGWKATRKLWVCCHQDSKEMGASALSSHVFITDGWWPSCVGQLHLLLKYCLKGLIFLHKMRVFSLYLIFFLYYIFFLIDNGGEVLVLLFSFGRQK